MRHPFLVHIQIPAKKQWRVRIIEVVVDMPYAQVNISRGCGLPHKLRWKYIFTIYPDGFEEHSGEKAKQENRRNLRNSFITSFSLSVRRSFAHEFIPDVVNRGFDLVNSNF
jgi:hypothetical protein